MPDIVTREQIDTCRRIYRSLPTESRTLKEIKRRMREQGVKPLLKAQMDEYRQIEKWDEIGDIEKTIIHVNDAGDTVATETHFVDHGKLVKQTAIVELGHLIQRCIDQTKSEEQIDPREVNLISQSIKRYVDLFNEEESRVNPESHADAYIKELAKESIEFVIDRFGNERRARRELAHIGIEIPPVRNGTRIQDDQVISQAQGDNQTTSNTERDS